MFYWKRYFRPFPGSVFPLKRNHGKSSILYCFWNYFLEVYSFVQKSQNTIFFWIYSNMAFLDVYSMNRIMSKVRLGYSLWIIYWRIGKKYWMLISYHASPTTMQMNNIYPCHFYYRVKSIIYATGTSKWVAIILYKSKQYPSILYCQKLSVN